jgi:hypothetical protein
MPEEKRMARIEIEAVNEACPGPTRESLRYDPRCRACTKCDALNLIFAGLVRDETRGHYRPTTMPLVQIAA